MDPRFVSPEVQLYENMLHGARIFCAICLQNGLVGQCCDQCQKGLRRQPLVLMFFCNGEHRKRAYRLFWSARAVVELDKPDLKPIAA